MMWRVVARSMAACLVSLPVALTAGVADAHAEPDICDPVVARNCADTGVVGGHVQGDTHIYGAGITQTIDCNQSTLLVNGSYNTIYALGSCWGVAVQGSSNMIIADNVVNDITVYGFDQTVLYKSGEPFVSDRGRQLGMVNHIDRVAA